MHGPEGVRFYTKLKLLHLDGPQVKDLTRICNANNESHEKKISLIGAGQIGGTLAHLIAIKE